MQWHEHQGQCAQNCDNRIWASDKEHCLLPPCVITLKHQNVSHATGMKLENSSHMTMCNTELSSSFKIYIALIKQYFYKGNLAAWLSGNAIGYYQDVLGLTTISAVEFFSNKESFHRMYGLGIFCVSVSFVYVLYCDVFGAPCILLTTGLGRTSNCVHISYICDS